MTTDTGFTVTTRTRASGIASVAALALVVVLIAVPFFAGRSTIQDIFFILTMLALAQYWNLLAGFAGLVSVGQQAFVGLGGYALFGASIILGINPMLAILIAGIVAAVLAVPTAALFFRLSGAYFAIGTWVAAEMFRLLLAQWKQLGGGTGTSLPRDVTRSTWGVEWVKELFDVRWAAAQDIVAYWLALALAVFTIGLVYGLLRSRQGLALSAIRDADIAAESVGVNRYRTRLLVYVAAAFGTGMVGALIYLQTARISPDAAFSVIDWTAFVIFIVVIGGIGTIEGPIVGVLVFFLLRETLADYGSWYLIVLGVIAIAVMLFAPKGIWGAISERFDIQLFPVRRRLVVPNSAKDQK